MRRIGLVAVALLGLSCGGKPDGLAALAEACHGDAEISCARPILNVHDMAASRRYFEKELGFELDWDYGDPPTFASVSRGDGVLFLCERCQSTPGAWTMVFARDVDALYDEYRDRHARIRMPPTDMPWGIRELHVTDLDGNVIRFGTGIED